mmetsp:Transcript_51376/g.117124  ORF Transcript_51376/g.117124 Transcript_51376/m.117124 type:complete len:430 (+) Transcript_51376:65-1354(+)
MLARRSTTAFRPCCRSSSWVQRAREMQKTPYDPATEGEINVHPYAGWDQGIQGALEKQKTGQQKARLNLEHRYQRICDSALDLIGHTPMVRMSRLAKKLNLECELLAKVEFFNAGGSVKDRIAKRMVEEWELLGKIKPGDLLIEPTSGNTGIGLCLAGALKGYRVIICLPQKMSGEKVNTMKALGAEILRTPTEAAWDAKDSHLFLAARLAKELNGHVLDQYLNVGNPLAHYEGTADEIIEQTGGDLDYMVMSAGTGGTLSGTAKGLREKLPNIKIVGVDPYGSVLAMPDNVNDKSPRTGQGRLEAYQVEGIGYDFIPTVLDRSLADYWVKTDDDEAFAFCRGIIRNEGLLIGGSCGSTMAGAYRFIKEHNIGKGKKVGVLFADGARNYMTKFLADEWMIENGFMEAGATLPKEVIADDGTKLYEAMMS